MTKLWDEISKPSFVINKKRAIANIKLMARKFNSQNILFRPHFKTHQSIEVGAWFTDAGVSKISVSSVDMARQFFDAGWRDISIVFSFNRREIKALNQFSAEAQISILLEDLDTAKYISENSTADLNVFLKIDCGYHRSGILISEFETIKNIALKIQELPKLKLKGLLSHFGNTYSAKNKEEVQTIFESSLKAINNLRDFLSPNFPDLIISIGDTPSASLMDNFSGVDEMRPGNFIFYDWMQYRIGSCTTDQISAIMLCPVVAKHADRNELIIHGGVVHFSKEKLEHYGPICDISNGFGTDVIDGVYLKSLSQEHGIVHCTEEFFSRTKIGDLIGVIPVHSCLSANLMKDNTVIY